MKFKQILPIIGISIFSVKNFVLYSIGSIPLEYVLSVYETFRTQPASFCGILVITYLLGVLVDKIFKYLNLEENYIR